MPLLLDLFCGAGGAAAGYADAGFDILGVDIEDQPHYPFDFHKADAMTFAKLIRRFEIENWSLDDFDAIHGSPPCQRYSSQTVRRGYRYPDLVGPLRHRLTVLGKPWVIENVQGAPLRKPIVLCGTMFGLRVIRHRLFESSVPLTAPESPQGCRPWEHPRVATRKADWVPGESFLTVTGHGIGSVEDSCDAMGINWTMTRKEVNQAIPPAYTKWVGDQLIRALY